MGTGLKIKGLRVDLPALTALAHDCRPETCPAGRSCCAVFHIEVTRREIEEITGWFPLAAKYAPGLADRDGFRNVFEEEDRTWSSVDAREDGACVFSYPAANNRLLCSLHTAALDLGRQPESVKPQCCSLWPLTLSGRRPQLLTVHADTYNFPCNQRRKKSQNLHPGVANIIKNTLGPKLLQAIEAALEDIGGTL